ncbi:hypothetical protein [Streptomyces litchfieldiae]|uniref:Nucleotide exchange factor GrpE n=1 Tax=Streptomyces litchfieldiae TaxID=3075543 RepID=A0ABU2MU04_9ACTN|nr:hypothetical protein [Streptomyces sp. DSM 44938]MDT0344956.1 hypothetical protein [Streptomyces sp. DSM 44938]
MTSRARRRVRHVRDALAQLRHPPEFRVPRPFLAPAQADWVADVLAEAEAARVEAAEALAGRADTSDSPGSDALVGAATGIWRALRKLDQDIGALSAADLRQVRRQVHASRQALADDGLEIQEHDGAPFDSGLSLEVLMFQDMPELTGEVVLETVRPSVYFRGERIQMGQVIVGRPAPEQIPGT